MASGCTGIDSSTPSSELVAGLRSRGSVFGAPGAVSRPVPDRGTPSGAVGNVVVVVASVLVDRGVSLDDEESVAVTVALSSLLPAATAMPPTSASERRVPTETCSHAGARCMFDQSLAAPDGLAPGEGMFIAC